MDEITLINPTPASGSTFKGWTGTGLSGLTTSVTIPVGSKGNRTYTANYEDPDDPDDPKEDDPDEPNKDDPENKSNKNSSSNGAGGGNGGTAVASIGDTATPKVSKPSNSGELITDPEPPLADNRYWALLNLILMAITALLGAALLARYFFGGNNSEEEETKRNNGKLFGLIPGIGSVIAFILTEDISLPMQMVDKWTIPMALILAVQIGVAAFSRKRDKRTA